MKPPPSPPNDREGAPGSRSAAPTQRTPPQDSGGTSGTCTGSLSIDWNDFVGSQRQKPIHQSLRPGLRLQAQAWFRDPPSPRTTSLSNAIEFQVGP